MNCCRCGAVDEHRQNDMRTYLKNIFGDIGTVVEGYLSFQYIFVLHRARNGNHMICDGCFKILNERRQKWDTPLMKCPKCPREMYMEH